MKTYTRDQVNLALNQAADAIRDDDGIMPYEDSTAIRIQTIVDLLVAVTMRKLDEPGISLDDVMRDNWQADEDEDGTDDAAVMVRGWLA